MPGPLAGLRMLELAHERTAFAGKLLADAGADVRLLEPPRRFRAAADAAGITREQVYLLAVGETRRF